MSTKVIELNDGAIKIADASDIIATSTGFALVSGEKLVLGEQAEQQARLHPTQSYNKFWHELSMEALNHDNHIRHTADIAYEQLLHLSDLGAENSDVIFAVPSSFSGQQLAILLGLAKQSPLTPIGVVDCAAAAAVAAGVTGSAVYLDFQLHQVVLTQVVANQSTLSAKSVVQIPGVGIQNFVNLLMQQATDLFIEQSRFNPQHNAEYEQLLYNQLPNWLHQYDDSQTSLMLELKTTDAMHTAKMPKESLIASLQGRYQQIQQELIPLLAEDSTIVLCDRLASLPGFIGSLPDQYEYEVLANDSLSKACLANIDAIASTSESIHLVRELPYQLQDPQSLLVKESPAKIPTHILIDNHATPIFDRGSINGSGQFKLRDGSISIVCDAEYQLNQATTVGESPLYVGDELVLGKDKIVAKAIRVTNGE